MDLLFTIALLCQVHPSLQDIVEETYRRDLSQMICHKWYVDCVEQFSDKMDEAKALKKCIKMKRK
jgi:hypothetical protein